MGWRIHFPGCACLLAWSSRTCRYAASAEAHGPIALAAPTGRCRRPSPAPLFGADVGPCRDEWLPRFGTRHAPYVYIFLFL